jgi:DNA mismatch repair protein MutL
MTVNQASSPAIIIPLICSFPLLELIEELKLSLVNTGFVFEETNNHIVISGIPVNVSEVSGVRTVIE